MTPQRPASRTPRRRRPTAAGAAGAAGFTLVELLVTISIITLLLGISIPAAMRLFGQADVAKTQAQLNQLAAAADEYRLKTGEVPNHIGLGNGAVTTDDNDDRTIALFLREATQLGGAVEALINTATRGQDVFRISDDEFVVPDSSQLTFGQPNSLPDWQNLSRWRLVDDWEGTLRYAAKVSYADTFTADDYLPAHPTPFFASAGPDEQWGDAKLLAELERGVSITDEDDLEAARQAEDNIYSFDIE